MNTGYVVRPDRPFDPESIEQSGQEDITGDSWDWVSTPTVRREAVLYEGDENREELVEFVAGEVTWTHEVEEDAITVKPNGTVGSTTERRSIREAAEWLLVPDKQIGVVSDEAAIYYIESSLPGVTLKSREINIRTFADSIDAQTWGVGFAGRLVTDGANKGSVYGKRLEEDPDIGDDLNETYLSQVGFEHTFRHDTLKAYASESGYIAAHGEEWTSRDFVPWLVQLVSGHLRDAEAEEDEGQSTLDEATPSECDECGRETETTEQHGDEELCIVCDDKRKEETEEYAEGAAAGGDD